MANAQRLRPDDDEPAGAAMGFLEHLDELRTRIVRSCIAIAGGMVIAAFFVNQIADFVLAPTLRLLPEGSQLITTRWSEGFSFYLNVTLIGGIVLSAPFVAFQVWRFIAPGLHTNEKKLAVPFVALASAGTLAGAAFSHYVLFPSTIAFFASLSSPRIRLMPGVEDTFDQYLRLMIGMIIVFQLPTVVFFLARMRVVTARFLWRNIKYAILIIFIVAAALTSSTDGWTQAVFAAPMLGLYVISIGIAWLATPRRDATYPTRNGVATLTLVVAAAGLKARPTPVVRGGRLPPPL